MKSYSISKKRLEHSKDYKAAIVTITNSDEHAIIRSLTFYETHLSPSEIRFSLHLAFEGNTLIDPMKEMFKSLGGNYLNRLNMTIIDSNNIQAIKNFFDYSQTIDLVPLQALHQLREQLPSFDLLNNEKIKTLVGDGKHSEALKLTLEYDAEGDDNALIYLINLYQAKEDLENYRHVLSHLPPTHPSFVNANLELLEHCLSTTPAAPNNSPNEKIAYLETLFKYALNAELYAQASCYFDELCGGSGLTPEINPIKGDADTLILIARKQRKMHAEIERLQRTSNLFLNLEDHLAKRPDGEEKSKMTADFIALLVAIKNKVDFAEISKGSGITDDFYTKIHLEILHISKLENRDPNIILHDLFNAYIKKLNSIPAAAKNETQHLISDGLKLSKNTFYKLHFYLKNTNAFEPNNNEKKAKNLDDFFNVIGIDIPTEKDSSTDYRKALRQKAKQYSPYAPFLEERRPKHPYHDEFSDLMSELYTKNEDALVSERKAYEAMLERQHKASPFAAKIRERLMSERQQQASDKKPTL